MQVHSDRAATTGSLWLSQVQYRFCFLFFFGKLNRNGWPVPVLTSVEEPSCHTPKPLPPHSVFFFCVFFFLGFLVVTAVAATAEGAAPWTLGCGPAFPAGGTPLVGSLHS